MPAKDEYTVPVLRSEAKEADNKGDNNNKLEGRKEETQHAAKQSRKDSKSNEPKDCASHWEDAVQLKKGPEEYEKFKAQEAEKENEDTVMEDDDEDEDEDEDAASASTSSQEDQPKKRGRGANASTSASNKKQKQNSKDEPNGTAGDKTRVPQQGQKVQWKALSNIADGEVVEVVYEEKTVGGKTAKGSKEDPRVVVKTENGKTVVHKPGALYFD
jgi:hypothetical protein